MKKLKLELGVKACFKFDIVNIRRDTGTKKKYVYWFNVKYKNRILELAKGLGIEANNQKEFRELLNEKLSPLLENLIKIT